MKKMNGRTRPTKYTICNIN